MVATLIKRIERAEQDIGDNPCERCNNTTVVVDSSGNMNVIKDQGRLSDEAAEGFYDEEQPDDRCPLCERQRVRVRVGWSPGSSAKRA